MKVVISSRAKNDLAEFVAFIANDKPRVARNWAARIRKSISNLSKFPKMGRVVPEYGDDTIREIVKGNYRIVYKIDNLKKTIVVLAIHHSKRPLV